MNRVTMRFLSGVLMLCFCGVSAAHAVPTVKRLGSNSARVGTATTTTTAPTPKKASSTSTPQRLGSIRSVSASAPVSANRVSGSTSSSDDANRLGFKIGPYIQTGKTLPAAQRPQSAEQPVTPTEFNLTAGDWILLENNEISLNPTVVDRISDLEDLIQDKQNILTVGEGLSLIDDHLTLDFDLSQLEGTTYTGAYGIAVDNESHQVKVDITNPVEGALYVFKDGQWVILNIKEEWDPMH